MQSQKETDFFQTGFQRRQKMHGSLPRTAYPMRCSPFRMLANLSDQKVLQDASRSGPEVFVKFWDCQIFAEELPEAAVWPNTKR